MSLNTPPSVNKNKLPVRYSILDEFARQNTPVGRHKCLLAGKMPRLFAVMDFHHARLIQKRTFSCILPASLHLSLLIFSSVERQLI